MSWKELLKRDIEYTYQVTEGLMNMVDEDQLDWKPSAGSNWMTMGQLLMHLTNACGAPIRSFITNDWRMPDGLDLSKLSPEEMMPPADKMPGVESVALAKQMIAEDRQMALDMLQQCSENDLNTRIATAPWDPTEMILGHRMLQMVMHLTSHKSQLFYYLKLQGKPVNTGHLWGMM